MTALLMLNLTPVIGQLDPGDHTRSIEVGNRTRKHGFRKMKTGMARFTKSEAMREGGFTE